VGARASVRTLVSIDDWNSAVGEAATIHFAGRAYLVELLLVRDVVNLLGLLIWLSLNVEHDRLLLGLSKLLVGLVANRQLLSATGRCLGKTEVLVLVSVGWHWDSIRTLIVANIRLE
jgi:hypothetical protein